jgi:hypothetical protein
MLVIAAIAVIVIGHNIMSRINNPPPYSDAPTAKLEQKPATPVILVRPVLPLKAEQVARTDPFAAAVAAIAGDSLPSEFYGIPPVDILHVVNSASSSIAKEEYETNAQFDARVKAGIKERLAPLDLTTGYPLPVDFLKSTYDADSETLTVPLEVTRGDQSDGQVLRHSNYIELTRHEKQYGSYTGHNAFGASADVAGKEATDIQLLLEKGDKFFTKAPLHADYSFSRDAKVVWKIHWPRGEARDSGGSAQVGMLLVTRLRLAQVYEHDSNTTPTLKHPVELMEHTFYIPGEIKEVVIYVRSTGEVLKRIRI